MAFIIHQKTINMVAVTEFTDKRRNEVLDEITCSIDYLTSRTIAS